MHPTLPNTLNRHPAGVPRRPQAFTQIELLTVLAVVLALFAAAWTMAKTHRTRARRTLCAANLGRLGSAFTLYAQDNTQRLPYAYLKHNLKHFQTWDSLTLHYLPAAASNPTNTLRCPSDSIPTGPKVSGVRRSYSMAFHDMDAGSSLWPPGPDNSTGVGVWWEDGRKEMARLSAFAGLTNSDWETTRLPAVELGMIHSPQATLLLTEQARPNNTAFGYQCATIKDPALHVDRHYLQLNDVHGGTFNYLMVDGHVEAMYPLQSVGQPDYREPPAQSRRHNLWTIRDND